MHIFLDIFLTNWCIILLFFIIAILYSSVGFGGGSSYLAVLALTGIAFTQIRSTALLCNIVVVFGNVLYFYKEKLYSWKKVIPLIIFSVPMAFLGGYLRVEERLFFVFLGITLLLASVFMWISKSNFTEKNKDTTNVLKNVSYGGIIGFISGMVGIGGGVFLAPLLYLTNWDISKKIAATASFFILVNSFSGLIGQIVNPSFSINWYLTSILLFTVFIGGKIGNRLRNKLLNPVYLKKATAILIAFVSIRILIKYLI